MTAFLRAQPATVRWLFLLVLTVVLCTVFVSLGLSAGLLIGSMAAAILLAVSEADLRVSQPLFFAAQAVVGCMIARTLRVALLSEVAQSWPLFLFAVFSVVVAACGLGWVLTRWRVLPGSTAVWGAFPGAATAMTIMAEAYGADVRLVAFMQYLRVVMVTLVATAVAHAFAVSGGDNGIGPLFPPVDDTSLAATLAVALAGGVMGWALPINAGPLLVPMIMAALLQNFGLIRIELPPMLLAAAYAIVGWSIGLRFSRDILRYATHASPRVAAAIGAMILGCGLFAVVLVYAGGIDPLTAYLAMSPGGADTIAIIAASSHRVDMPFVMALQLSRFLIILIVGPRLARFIADRASLARTTSR